MRRGLAEVHRAVRDALARISKADGYWHDAPPIFPRLVGPQQALARPPYICLPLDDSGAYDDSEGQVLGVHVRQPIIVILPENNSTDFDTCGAADACRWHDDIVRSLAPSGDSGCWDLGSGAVVDDVVIVGKNLQSEPIDGFPAFVMVQVEALVRLIRDQIGRPPT